MTEVRKRCDLRLFGLLSNEFGFVVSRAEIPGFLIDARYREGPSVPAWWHRAYAQSVWWRQACNEANEAGRLPILFYRRSREPWRAVLPGLATGSGAWEPRLATFAEAVAELRESIAAAVLAGAIRPLQPPTDLCRGSKSADVVRQPRTESRP